jgi:hypothetical protein
MRRHPDPFAAGEHLDDPMSRCLGLARPWRPLDQRMTAIQPPDRVDDAGDLIRVIADAG